MIFKVAFCIWLDGSLLERMVGELGVRESVDTLEGFIQWANTENEPEGKYCNFLEAFLWFCGDWQKKNGRIFQ